MKNAKKFIGILSLMMFIGVGASYATTLNTSVDNTEAIAKEKEGDKKDKKNKKAKCNKSKKGACCASKKTEG